MLRSWLVKPKIIIAVASATTLLLLPKPTSTITVRSPQKPLSIRAPIQEPAKEAFDDMFKKNEDNSDWKNAQNITAKNLNALASENKNWNPLVEVNQRHIFLPSLSFNKNMIDNSEPSSLADAQWIEELTPAQRARIQAADEKSQVLSKDWSLPSWREFAAQKISEAKKTIAGTNAGNNDKSAGNIYVSAKGKDGSTKTVDSVRVADVNLAGLNTSSGIQINGNVRLMPGLALGDRVLELRRFVEGVAIESGKIDAQKGTFSIEVASLQGSVSAELFDKSGAIVATGSYRLKETGKNNEAEIFIAPKSQFAGNLTNFNKDPDKLYSTKLNSTRGQPAEVLYASLGVSDKTDALGGFSFGKISESSYGLVRTRAKGFADGLYLLGAGEGQNMSMMPEHMILALKEITKNYYQNGNTQKGPQVSLDGLGLIWGQVLFDGKPLADVTVEIEQEDIPAIYLDGFIPSETLVKTTGNGYFVFPALAKGMYSLVAKRNNEYVGHMNVEVDDGTVSIGTIEATTKNQPAQIKIYDAFDGSPQQSQIQLQSLKQSEFISGQAEIILPIIHRMSLGYSQPNATDYISSQIVYQDTDEYIHVPLIRSEWLQFLINEHRISIEPGAGTVIGFVPEDNFEAYLSHEDAYAAQNIVYFDHAGRIVESGVAGGGFVMFNVPVATQSIVVMSKKTEMISSQVIPVGADSNTTIKFRF